MKLLLLLLLAGHACADEALGCETDEDCSLLGVCTSGACHCDPGWHGDDCGQLGLLPVKPNSGYNLTGEGISSWGANIFPATHNGAETVWHMYAAEFENKCGISHWSPNSAIVHATSTSGPAGPYTRKDVAVVPFAHNPKVVRAPDGTWLMYTIGVQLPASKLFNCSHSQQVEEPPPAPTPGRNPENLESNITLFTSKSLEGPWTRYGTVLGPDYKGMWDEDTSNPSPWVLPNGVYTRPLASVFSRWAAFLTPMALCCRPCSSCTGAARCSSRAATGSTWAWHPLRLGRALTRGSCPDPSSRRSTRKTRRCE